MIFLKSVSFRTTFFVSNENFIHFSDDDRTMICSSPDGDQLDCQIARSFRIASATPSFVSVALRSFVSCYRQTKRTVACLLAMITTAMRSGIDVQDTMIQKLWMYGPFERPITGQLTGKFRLPHKVCASGFEFRTLRSDSLISKLQTVGSPHCCHNNGQRGHLF